MNWSNFFSMGGYAVYVWGSYAVALIVMGGEVILLLRRKKSLVKRPGYSAQSASGNKYENKA